MGRPQNVYKKSSLGGWEKAILGGVRPWVG
jgi:hypothetical protein